MVLQDISHAIKLKCMIHSNYFNKNSFMNNRMTSIVKPNINLFFFIKVHVDKENIDIYTCTCRTCAKRMSIIFPYIFQCKQHSIFLKGFSIVVVPF